MNEQEKAEELIEMFGESLAIDVVNYIIEAVKDTTHMNSQKFRASYLKDWESVKNLIQ